MAHANPILSEKVKSVLNNLLYDVMAERNASSQKKQSHVLESTHDENDENCMFESSNLETESARTRKCVRLKAVYERW